MARSIYAPEVQIRVHHPNWPKPTKFCHHLGLLYTPKRFTYYLQSLMNATKTDDPAGQLLFAPDGGDDRPLSPQRKLYYQRLVQAGLPKGAALLQASLPELHLKSKCPSLRPCGTIWDLFLDDEDWVAGFVVFDANGKNVFCRGTQSLNELAEDFDAEDILRALATASEQV